jgi:dTDP-4-dehydrorhamnose reductase
VINILITGSNGQLGSHFNNIKDSLFNIIPSYYKKKSSFVLLDITNEKDVKDAIKSYNPDIIINTAAITDVDFCELNKSIAREVNVQGLRNLIKHSSSNTKIIQISTDYIYDGKIGNYNEKSLPNPANYYGKTKLEAENILLSSNKKFIIIRVATLFSNYSNNFYKWIVNNLKSNNILNVVDDQISNPCYALNLVNLILDLILLDYTGKINFGSINYLSRYDFALEIANSKGLNNELIKLSKTNNINYLSNRPLNTSFDLQLCKKLNIKLFSSKDTLKYINTL